MDLPELLASAKKGDRRKIGRLVTVIENRSPGYRSIISKIRKNRGEAFVLGITGPPGAGKSTLISRIANEFSRKEKLGIIMIDASSPYSGGSLLGNRLRLDDDKSVFARSMATRGQTGGLNLALGDTIDLLSYLGFSMIIVESVGTGQDETDILYYSDKIVLVLAPGTGDQIQALKAGQMEIGDLIVLNKADKPESIISEKELVEILSIPDLSKSHEFFKVSALTGDGVKDLTESIEEAREKEGKGHEHDLARAREKLRRELFAAIDKENRLIKKYASKIIKGEITYYEAILAILDKARERQNNKK